MSKGVKHFKHLHGQLPDRDQDDGTETVDGHNFISIQLFNERNEIRKGLARTCSTGRHDITPSQGMGNDTSLDFSHFDKVLFRESFERKCRHRKIREVDLKLLMELVSVHDGLFMLGLIEFIIVKVVPTFGCLGLNALLKPRYVCESLDFGILLFFHCSDCFIMFFVVDFIIVILTGCLTWIKLESFNVWLNLLWHKSIMFMNFQLFHFRLQYLSLDWLSSQQKTSFKSFMVWSIPLLNWVLVVLLSSSFQDSINSSWYSFPIPISLSLYNGKKCFWLLSS